MDIRIRLALAAIFLSASALHVSPVFAGEMSTCPDLPARQAVLDEGNQIYSHEGVSSKFNEDLPHSSTFMRAIGDDQIVRPFGSSPQLDDPPLETKSDLENLKLDYPGGEWNALQKAEKLELYMQPALARILYARMLPTADIPIRDIHYNARVWEGYARTVLLLPFDTSSSWELPFPNRFAAMHYLQSKRKEETSRFTVVAAVNKVTSEQDLQVVEDACNNALRARNVLNGNREAATENFMILGAIAERDKRPVDAFSYYLPAIQLEHYTRNMPIRKDETIGEVASALQEILDSIEKIDGTDEQLLAYLSEFDELLARVPGEMVGVDKIKEKANRLLSFHKEQIRIRPCLEMAANLSTTAFNLERTDHFDMAWKLYHEALVIKQLNLGPNHIDTTMQLVDLARVAAEQKRYTVSQSMYEQALSAMRKNPKADSADMVTVLESYAQMLVSTKQTAKADKIYDEARARAIAAARQKGQYQPGSTH